MNENAHLVYLTGLSMDKKRLNYITENINRDIDFTFWFNKTQKAIKDILKNNKIELTNSLDSNINIIKIIIESIIKKKFPNNYDEIQENIHPILTDILDLKKIEGNYSFRTDVKYDLNEFLDDMASKVDTYHNGDFFSLYISHQSDSIGVQPLSKISSSNNLTFLNSYCDRPYYDNKYINHIILKVKKNNIKEKYRNNFKDFIESSFYIHFLDTFLSNLVGASKSNNLSYFDMISNSRGARTLKDIQASLSERNFYGISLLSQFLFNLEKLLINEKIKINVDNNDIEKREFLKELFISASNPNDDICSLDGDIEADIYFSDGLKLVDNNSINNIFSVFNEITEKEMGEETASDDRVDSSYFSEDSDCFYIKIPIKITLSLPFNEDGKVDASLVIPYGVDSEDHNVIDIITIGGAEHNRALAHIINKHRLQYKEKRIFGFMDNRYDLINKVNFISDNEYEHSFLMGLNQPVAGYNAIFTSRVDNEKGESISLDTKLLGYRVADNNKTYNILTIYGFSALSSVFGIHYVVSEIDNKIEKCSNLNKGIFVDRYLPALEDDKNMHKDQNIDLVNKGLSALILYPEMKLVNKQLDEQFKGKVPLYIFNNDFELYKKTFLLNDEKEALYQDVKRGTRTRD